MKKKIFSLTIFLRLQFYFDTFVQCLTKFDFHLKSFVFQHGVWTMLMTNKSKVK